MIDKAVGMRWPHPIGLGVAMLLLAAEVSAADTPRFYNVAITFPVTPMTFPVTPVTFPSAPMQTETATTLEITLPADVLFDFDKADIRPAAQSALRELAEIIQSKARGPVSVQGYTDALGADAYNQTLSERRAKAVVAWLAGKEGVPTKTLSASGLGARNPVAPNRKTDGSDDPDGRQLNRRVTVIIRK